MLLLNPNRISVFRSIFLLVLFVLPAWLVPSVEAKELKVGLGELDYPPFYFMDDETLKGAAVEIAQQISGKLGHQLIYKRYPFARLQLLLQQGKIDLMILYFKTPAREKDAVYTELPHIYESSYLFTAKGAGLSFTGNLEDLSAYKFGNVRGYSHGKDYDGAEYLDKQPVGDEQTLLRMLIGGRFDIAVGNKPAILMQAKQTGLEDAITFMVPTVDNGPNYFAFSKARSDAQELAREFSIAIREFIDTDTYREILKKYGFDVPRN